MPYYRKLQKIGGSSYFITLPKDWIQKNSLNKSEIISLTESATGDLIVALSKFTKNIKSANLELDKTDRDLVIRMATSAYINGCTEMTISSSDKQNLKSVEKYIQSRFPGFILRRVIISFH